MADDSKPDDAATSSKRWKRESMPWNAAKAGQNRKTSRHPDWTKAFVAPAGGVTKNQNKDTQ